MTLTDIAPGTATAITSNSPVKSMKVLFINDYLPQEMLGLIEEAVGLVVSVHLSDGVLDHALDGLVGVAPTDGVDHVGIDR